MEEVVKQSRDGMQKERNLVRGKSAKSSVEREDREPFLRGCIEESQIKRTTSGGKQVSTLDREMSLISVTLSRAFVWAIKPSLWTSHNSDFYSSNG